MTSSAKELLASFDQLPEPDQREVAEEILKKTAHLEFPPISDEALVQNAEELFLELDRREAEADETA